MTLSNDLLEQARFLANRDARRPKQASLRRAISACYYALFHQLISDAAKSISSEANLQRLIERMISHSDLRTVSADFARTKGLPVTYQERIGPIVVGMELQSLARLFVTLQEERHRADYDTHAVFRRFEVLELVDRTEAALVSWDRIKTMPDASRYLISLVFWNRWKNVSV